ncbi:MAG: hypothetical protein R3F61_14005 [Myxococcota bacterium]
MAERSLAIRYDVLRRAVQAGRQDVLDALVPGFHPTLDACFDPINPLPREVRHAAAIALMDAGAVLEVDGPTVWMPARAARDGFPDDRVLAMLRSLPEDVRRSSTIAVLQPAAMRGRLALFDQLWEEVGTDAGPIRGLPNVCGAGAAAVDHVKRMTGSTEDPWTCDCMERGVESGHLDVLDRRDSLEACADKLWGLAWSKDRPGLIELLDARVPRAPGADAARRAAGSGSVGRLELAIARGAPVDDEVLLAVLSRARDPMWMDDETLMALVRVLLAAGARPPNPRSAVLDRLSVDHREVAELLLEAASAEAE